MNPLIAAAAVLALVLLAGGLGVSIRRRDGRVRRARGDFANGLVPASLRGEAATLVQFSTPLCARCPGTARMLTAVAAEHEGVSHFEIDLETRPELARRFTVLQTPTVLVLDREQRIRARIGGTPRRGDLIGALDAIVEDRDTGAYVVRSRAAEADQANAPARRQEANRVVA